ERAGPAGPESAGQHPRRQGRGALPPRPLRAAPRDARRRLSARIPHGWSLFPPRYPRPLGARGGGVRDQGAVSSLAWAEGAGPPDADLDPGDRRRHLHRAHGRGHLLAAAVPDGPLPSPRRVRDGEELLARPLRPERWTLRVQRRRDEQAHRRPPSRSASNVWTASW